jgi:serine/threonine protein kinase
MREARLTARLHHPHAVTVYDVVETDGRPCLIMQYLPSTSLDQVLASKGPQQPAQVARWGAQIASALATAHEAGIVHRDVKPGNILIGEEGSAAITDFGIAHALGDPSLTSTGLVTGTPAFLAPEAARGVDSGRAADVFSLGATLYAAVEGEPPFGTDPNPMAMLHRVASGSVRPPRRAGPLTGLLERMLQLDPAARPPMRDVVHELDALAATGALASAPTQSLAHRTRTAPAVEPAVPPSVAPRTVRARPPAPPSTRRRRSGAAWAAAAVLVAALVVAAVVAALENGSGRSSQAGRTPSTAPRPAAPAQHSPPTSQPQQQTTSATTAGSTGSGNSGAGGRAAQLAAAITDYYALLPGNTDAAWNRLTKHFQEHTANGRDTFDQYWGSVQSISVTDAVTTGPKDAVATLHYVYRDGRRVTERTAFHFKDEDGQLKIDRTGAPQ